MKKSKFVFGEINDSDEVSEIIVKTRRLSHLQLRSLLSQDPSHCKFYSLQYYCIKNRYLISGCREVLSFITFLPTKISSTFFMIFLAREKKLSKNNFGIYASQSYYMCNSVTSVVEFCGREQSTVIHFSEKNP